MDGGCLMKSSIDFIVFLKKKVFLDYRQETTLYDLLNLQQDTYVNHINVSNNEAIFP